MAGNQDLARVNVRRLLQTRGLTREELGERSDIAIGTLNNWLKPTNPPNLGTHALKSVAEALGVTVEYLYTEGVKGILPMPQIIGESETKRRIMAEIDMLLDSLADDEEMARAGNIIKAVLRTAADDYAMRQARERRQSRPPGTAG